MWVIPQNHDKVIRLSKFYSTVAAAMEHVFKHVHNCLLLFLLLREGEEEGGLNQSLKHTNVCTIYAKFILVNRTIHR